MAQMASAQPSNARRPWSQDNRMLFGRSMDSRYQYYVEELIQPKTAPHMGRRPQSRGFPSRGRAGTADSCRSSPPVFISSGDQTGANRVQLYELQQSLSHLQRQQQSQQRFDAGRVYPYHSRYQALQASGHHMPDALDDYKPSNLNVQGPFMPQTPAQRPYSPYSPDGSSPLSPRSPRPSTTGSRSSK